MSYASEVMADAPIGAYTFDQASGNWVDFSGHAYDLTPGTGVTRGKTGIVLDGGTAVSGSGTATIGHKTSGITGITASNMSLEVWIRTSATSPVSAKGGMVKIGGTGNGFTLGVGNSRNDQLGKTVTLGVNGWNWWGLQYDLAPSTQYHLVLTYNGSVWTLYVNGTAAGGPATTPHAPTTPSQQIHVGDEEENANAFLSSSIDVDAVAVYNTALTAARVLAHYTAGTTASSGDASVTAVAATATAATPVPVVASSASVAATAATASAAAPAPVASVSASAAPPVALATAAALEPSVSGTSGTTVSAPPATASAVALPPSVAASASVLAALANASAAVLPPNVGASANATVTAVPATATATAIVPTIGDGTGNYSVFAVPATATATAPAPGVVQVLSVSVDTSNAFDGLDVVARALVSVTTPIAPALVGAAERYDVAIPYPVPVMVDGRPT